MKEIVPMQTECLAAAGTSVDPGKTALSPQTIPNDGAQTELNADSLLFYENSAKCG